MADLGSSSGDSPAGAAGTEGAVLVSPRIIQGPFQEIRGLRVKPGYLGDLEEADPEIVALAVYVERVDDRVLDLMPNLRIVSNNGVGYDNIDVAACRARGIVVTNTPNVVDGATADMALGLMLASRRRLLEADALVRRGDWEKAVRKDPIFSRDLTRSTLGIVGCGRIGREVAKRARAFDMTLLYTQRTRLDEAVEREYGLTYCTLEELMQRSDIVSIHTPLTPATRGLIGAEELALMRDGSCLVNTARGPIIDEEALVAELKSGRINAGLDVFANEPKVPRELFDLPNVVLAPHAGTATIETRTAMAELVVENINRFLESGEPLTPVTS